MSFSFALLGSGLCLCFILVFCVVVEYVECVCCLSFGFGTLFMENRLNACMRAHKNKHENLNDVRACDNLGFCSPLSEAFILGGR